MLLATGTAVIGVLTGAAGPVARWWGQRNGHTGNLKSLLLSLRKGTPEKVPVHVFAPPAKTQAEEASVPSTRLLPTLRTAVKAEDTVFRVAVPKGTDSEILRAQWPTA